MNVQIYAGFRDDGRVTYSMFQHSKPAVPSTGGLAPDTGRLRQQRTGIQPSDYLWNPTGDQRAGKQGDVSPNFPSTRALSVGDAIFASLSLTPF